MDTASNIDLEVLTLILGVPKASMVSNTTPEVLSSLLSQIYPENHDFFAYVRSCVISYISKVGLKTASSMLNLSTEALSLIFQSSTDTYTTRNYKGQIKFSEITQEDLNQEILINESEDITILEDGRRLYSSGFKKKVINDYYETRSSLETAKKFNLPYTQVDAWLFKVVSGEALTDYPGKKRAL